MAVNRNTKAAIRRGILAWFDREQRDLPWRRTQDPYCIWLSEIMLQQTRVEQGLPYYQRFIHAFPTVEQLAQASDDAVLKLWEGLGYYGRARNLQRAARLITFERDGAFPKTAAEWEALPGVGRYTAGAIASIAFGEAVPVVDGNIKRVLARLFDIGDPIDDAATAERLWEIAGELVPSARPGDFNQALMELGARVCTPRAPSCSSCPLAHYCAALDRGDPESRPIRRARKAPRREEVAVAVIRKGPRYLVGKRPPTGLLAGLWEFPGGKIEAGETCEEALAREAREELGVEIRPGKLIAVVDHAYTHLRVRLNVCECRIVSGSPKAAAHVELRWATRTELDALPMPKADLKFLHLLA